MIEITKLDSNLRKNTPKKLAILQSNYIPWKGYFDIIAAADEFIIYDEVQYTKNDWRNRNKIKTRDGLIWLTVPVGANINRKICEVEIASTHWQRQHWEALRHNYSRASNFEEIAADLSCIYLEQTHKNLSALNAKLINYVCSKLGIGTKIRNSNDYSLRADDKSARLVSLCEQVGASIYVSGPSAKQYLDSDLFEKHGISIEWMNYQNYSEYQQLWGKFVHQVSVLDLLFNTGKSAANHMKFSKTCK